MVNQKNLSKKKFTVTKEMFKNGENEEREREKEREREREREREER